jgi:putative salt-induced outer membrane protein YdiY
MQFNHTQVRPLVSTALLIAFTAAAHAGTGSGKTSVGKSDLAVPPLSPWEVTAAAGLGLTRGNQDTLNASAQFLATYLEGANEALFGIDYAYGEDGSATTVNNVHGFAAYNRTLAGPLYAGGVADAWYDEIAALDYRISAMPTLGFYLIKNESTVLALEGGLGYIWENQDDLSDSYWAFRVGQRFSHTTASGLKLTQSVTWSPELDDTDNWFLTAQAGIAVPVSTHWAVGVTGRYTLDNTPAAGLEKDDLAVLATLTYSLKGFAPEAAAGRRTLKAEKKAAALPEMGWSRMAGLSFALTRGNSETLNLIGDYTADYRSEAFEWLNAVGLAYGETGDATTLENVRAATQFNKTLTGNLYAGAGTGFRYDDIAAIDYQVTPAVVLGTYLIKNDTAKLSIEAGPGYVFEKVGDVKSDYFAVQAAQKLAWALADGVTLTQAVLWNAEAEDFGNYTLTATAALEVDMGANLSFRTAVSNIYDSTPATGLEENDLLLSAGVAVRF